MNLPLLAYLESQSEIGKDFSPNRNLFPCFRKCINVRIVKEGREKRSKHMTNDSYSSIFYWSNWSFSFISLPLLTFVPSHSSHTFNLCETHLYLASFLILHPTLKVTFRYMCTTGGNSFEKAKSIFSVAATFHFPATPNSTWTIQKLTGDICSYSAPRIKLFSLGAALQIYQEHQSKFTNSFF